MIRYTCTSWPAPKWFHNGLRMMTTRIGLPFFLSLYRCCRRLWLDNPLIKNSHLMSRDTIETAPATSVYRWRWLHCCCWSVVKYGLTQTVCLPSWPPPGPLSQVMVADFAVPLGCRIRAKPTTAQRGTGVWRSSRCRADPHDAKRIKLNGFLQRARGGIIM